MVSGTYLVLFRMPATVFKEITRTYNLLGRWYGMEYGLSYIFMVCSPNLGLNLLYNNYLQLFYSFFKSLIGKDVVVELKNDLA
jgi:hypothetical protein